MVKTLTNVRVFLCIIRKSWYNDFHMGIGTIRFVFLASITALLLLLLGTSSVVAQKTSSRPADLVNNDKVIYSLPDVGNVTPDHPLFVLKQIRDSFVLALPQDPISRAKTLIQMSDKYTVYGSRLVSLSRINRAVSSFELSLDHQASLEKTLTEEAARTSQQEPEIVSHLREPAIQSNIKQAEILRTLMDGVPSTEQPTFMDLLDKNMQLRKRLQTIE